MAFHIKNAATDALARQVAAVKNVGLTEAVHTALQNELDRDLGQQSLGERGAALVRKLRADGNPERGLPADKAFIDSLYE